MRPSVKTTYRTACSILAILLLATAASAERIKDVCEVHGVRDNPISGYGLVVGLAGTGDGSVVSERALANMLRRSGLVLDAAELESTSIASVWVTARLGAFSRPGSELDVTVSAVGDATSLQGGTLLMTPLRGADGEVYAVAQGSLTVGGYSATGTAGSVSKNHPTVGRIPGGATVERSELAEFVENGQVALHLRNPDFATAQSVADAINELHANAALAIDAGSISVRVPPAVRRGEIVRFIQELGDLQVEVDQPAVVVINERTGTIVVGENVSISMVAISHGNLSIVTEEKDFASQPAPFSETGETETLHRTEIRAIEEQSPLYVVERQVSVSDLARALNAMGLTPRDLIAIFEALRDAGALQAELKIM